MTQFSRDLNVLYDSVEEPIAINFSWAQQINPPRFEPSTQFAKLMPEGGSKTTLRFNSIEYTLSSVQFIKNSHTSWLLTKSTNREDLLIIFETSVDTANYKYLMFVIPIIQVSNGPKPKFFQELSETPATLTLDDLKNNNGYRIQSAFPSDINSQFAYYTTCINGYSTSAEIKNAYVFVAVEGYPIDAALMSAILTKSSEARTSFPANPDAPFMARFSRTKTQVGADFPNFVRTTRYLLDPEGRANYRRTTVAPREPVIVEDTLDPYKCVPFDPDTQVEDGKIRINAETGTPLSNIMEERAGVREEATATSATQKGIVAGPFGKVFSNLLGWFIVGLVGAALLGLLIFFIRSRRPTAGAAGVASAVAATTGPLRVSPVQWDSVLSYALLFVFAGFAGFLIGALLT